MKLSKTGCISVSHEKWKNDLTEEDKTFVQAFNAKVRHGESTKAMTLPSGVKIIENKTIRRTSDEIPDEEKQESKKESTQKRKDLGPRKKITFNLDHSKDKDEEDA